MPFLKHIYCILFCLLGLSAWGQGVEGYYDVRMRMIRHLPFEIDDTAKCLHLSHIAEYCDTIEKAFYYDSFALDLAQRLHFPYGTFYALSNKAGIYEVFNKDYTTAIRIYKMALDTLEYYHVNSNDKFVDDAGYGRLMNAYFYVGDFVNAMKVATTRLAYFEQAGNGRMHAKYNNLVGFIYLRQNKPADARKYYNLYMDYARSSKDSMLLADAYNCLADVEMEEHDNLTALHNLAAALDIYRQLKHRERIAYTLFKISVAHKLNGDYEQARNYAEQNLYMTTQVPCNRYDIAAYYINAADIDSHFGDHAAARKYATSAMLISKEIHHTEDLRDAYLSLSHTFAALKKYDSAYYYRVLFGQLKDSIINNKTQREIEQVQLSYELDKKNKEIVLLNQENKLHEANITRQKLLRNIIIITALSLVVVSVLLYNRRRLKQENKFQTELNAQKNELFHAVVTIQDKERKRIAQDIHDSVGSVLSAAKLKLSEIDERKNPLSEAQREKYMATLSLLDEAAGELRSISHNIMPANMQKLGLIPTLRSLTENISSYNGIQINFNTYGFDKRLSEETELSIYRIVLELLNNVIKHAQATIATIQLVAHPAYVNITVEDNGVGFNFETQKNKGKGIGLNNILSRVSYLEGTIDVDTAGGQGTLVSINIPYQNNGTAYT